MKELMDKDLELAIGGRVLRPVEHNGRSVNIYDDSDPVGVIIDDGAPI